MEIHNFRTFSKQNKSDYHDGIAIVFARPDTRSSFNALEKAEPVPELERKVKIAFREEYFRQQDIQFMDNHDAQKTRKIVVRTCRKIEKNDIVAIEKERYQIDYIDFNRKNNEMYLYLEGYDA